MAESKITVARVKDKVGGKEAEVSKLLYSEYGGLRILLNNGQYWACGYNAYCQITGNGSAVTPINYPILVL